ncbi:MAG: hypothetical protein WB504_17450, partial [Pseudolabrys sp.]
PNQPLPHIIIGVPRSLPALSKYDPTKEAVSEHRRDSRDNDRGDHFATLSPLMMACSFVSMIIGPIKKWPHKRGAAI